MFDLTAFLKLDFLIFLRSTLLTKDILDDSVISTVSNARKLGEDQFNTFLKERLVDRSKPSEERILSFLIIF